MKKAISIVIILALLIHNVLPVYAGKQDRGTAPIFSYMIPSKDGQPSVNVQNFYRNFNYWIDEDERLSYNHISGATVNSYLIRNSVSGYSRIEAIKGKVYVEQYSENFEWKATKELEMELPIFGGCYIGEQYSFLVFGQNNLEESDDVEVLRVVKYDKDWNRLDSTSVYGANTRLPFASGSLRMTESKGCLYIHTAHQMYKASDGQNHQANMTFVLDTETMEVTQDYYIIMNVSEGYVSHSFNQFVVSDGTYLYRLDHGDGAPRAVVVTKCKLASIDSCICKCVVNIPVGESGQNETGVSVGGFTLANDFLVSVGNCVEYDDTQESMFGVRNIYVTSTNKDFSSATEKTWITNYGEESSIIVGVPKLVKASEDTLYVLWEEADSEKELVFFRIAKVSVSGEVLQVSEPIYGRLSDCEPLYTSDGRLVWYTTYRNTPVFYSIDTKNLDSYRFSPIDLNDCTVTLDQKECIYSEIDSNEIPERVTYGDYILQKDSDYTVTYTETDLVGKVKVNIKGKGYFTGEVEKSYIIRPPKPEVFRVYSKTNNSVTLYWEKPKHVTGYQIEQKKDEDWILVQTLSDAECEVGQLESCTEYGFRIRSYTQADGTIYYGEYVEVATTTMLDSTVIEVKEIKPTSVSLAWTPVKGAVRYNVSWFESIGNTSEWVELETTELGCTIDNLMEGRKYMFRVSAYGEDELHSEKAACVSVELPYLLKEDNTEIKYYDDVYIYVPFQVREPIVRVTRGYGTLEAGRDYLVSYHDNTEIGTGKIVITGINRYAGTLERTFKILPDMVYEINATATEKAVSLSWSPVPGAMWYDIYSYLEASWIKIGSTSQTEYLADNLQANTKYIFKIAAYAEKNGEVYEGEFSDEKSISTKAKYVKPEEEVSPSEPSKEPTVSPLPSQSPTVSPKPVEKVPSVLPTLPEEKAPTSIPTIPTKKEMLSPQYVYLSKSTYTYDGKIKTPIVTVKNQRGEKLEAGKDYTVSYDRGRTQAGIYTVTVKGEAQYGGIVKKTFKIYPKATQITKLKRECKGIELQWKKGTGNINGYEIQCSVYSNFKKSSKRKVQKKKITSTKIRRLKANKKYYVRIRTYQVVKGDGKKVTLYSKWSKKKSIKIK